MARDILAVHFPAIHYNKKGHYENVSDPFLFSLLSGLVSICIVYLLQNIKTIR